MSNKDNVVKLLGVYLFVWLIVLVLVPVVVYTYHKEDSLVKTLSYIACAGGLGGVVYSIRGFYTHIFAKTFRKEVFWWYLFRPPISAVVGVMAYFLVSGGLLIVSNDPPLQRNIVFYLAIAFLAGFSFTQFADSLYRLSKRIFGEKKVKKK